MEILIAEEGSFRRSQEPRMKLETIIVKMAYLEPIIPLGEILSTIENIEQKLLKGSSADALNATLRVSENKSSYETPFNANVETSVIADSDKGNNHLDTKNVLDLNALSDNFKKFIKKENAILGAKIDSAGILSYENDCLTMGFPKSNIFIEEIKSKQKEYLEQIAGKFFQKNVLIKIEMLNAENGNANGNNGRSPASIINDIKREAMSQPLLRKVMDELSDAKVIDIIVQAEKN